MSDVLEVVPVEGGYAWRRITDKGAVVKQSAPFATRRDARLAAGRGELVVQVVLDEEG